MIQAKPVGPRLLVKPLDPSESMRSGIVLPVEVADGERRGVVQAVGSWYRELGEDGPLHSPLDVQPGEVVIYEPNTGTKVKLDLNEDGTYEEFVVLHVNDVLLILQEVYAEV